MSDNIQDDALFEPQEKTDSIDSQSRRTKKLMAFYKRILWDKKAKKRIQKSLNRQYSERTHRDEGKKSKQELKNTLRQIARNQGR